MDRKQAPLQVPDSAITWSTDVAAKPLSITSRSAVSRMRWRVAEPSRGMLTLVSDHLV
jgi:hypothetical protein